MVAFLAFASSTVCIPMWREGSGRGRFVVIGVVLAFDAVCIAILIARYGDGVWFPSDRPRASAEACEVQDAAALATARDRPRGGLLGQTTG